MQYFSKVDEYCHDDAENVYFPDSVYEERLERLPSVIRLPYNEVVRDCIDLYAGRKRDLVRYMLGMADFYFPIIEQVLDKHNLPLELKYLAVVESALNPVALSRWWGLRVMAIHASDRQDIWFGDQQPVG